MKGVDRWPAAGGRNLPPFRLRPPPGAAPVDARSTFFADAWAGCRCAKYQSRSLSTISWTVIRRPAPAKAGCGCSWGGARRRRSRFRGDPGDLQQLLNGADTGHAVADHDETRLFIWRLHRCKRPKGGTKFVQRMTSLPRQTPAAQATAVGGLRCRLVYCSRRASKLTVCSSGIFFRHPWFSTTEVRITNKGGAVRTVGRRARPVATAPRPRRKQTCSPPACQPLPARAGRAERADANSPANRDAKTKPKIVLEHGKASRQPISSSESVCKTPAQTSGPKRLSPGAGQVKGAARPLCRRVRGRRLSASVFQNRLQPQAPGSRRTSGHRHSQAVAFDGDDGRWPG